MKRIIFSLVILISFLTCNAQNPFARYGYKVKVSTMCNGKYDEFHDKDRIVEIGSVRFDTRTNKILGTVEDDSTNSQVNPHVVSRFVSIDPKAERYYSISPYVYCLNNPIKFIDPDGKKVYYANGSSEAFKNDVVTSVRSLNQHGVGGLFGKLVASDKIYYIAESPDAYSNFDPKSNTITWNPRQAMLTNNAIEISPTTLLNHEFDHGVRHDNDAKQQAADQKTIDPDFVNKEEKRVIQGSEQETAKALGEISGNEVTRTDHGGTLYETTDPTSTKRKTEIVIIPEPDKNKPAR